MITSTSQTRLVSKPPFPFLYFAASNLILWHLPLILAKRRRNLSHDATKLPHKGMRDDAHGVIEKRDTPLGLRICNLRSAWNELLDLVDKGAGDCIVAREGTRNILWSFGEFASEDVGAYYGRPGAL